MKKIYFMMFSLMTVGYTYAQEEPTTVTDTTEPMPATPCLLYTSDAADEL